MGESRSECCILPLQPRAAVFKESHSPFPLLPQTSTNTRLCSAAGEAMAAAWPLRACEPAPTGREHDGDARWVGGALTASAVLLEPGGGVAGVPASGHQPQLTFLIRPKTRCSEVRALPNARHSWTGSGPDQPQRPATARGRSYSSRGPLGRSRVAALLPGVGSDSRRPSPRCATRRARTCRADFSNWPTRVGTIRHIPGNFDF